MTKKQTPKEYLYDHFGVGKYDMDTFWGPKAGEKAEDFTFVQPDGSECKLSDLFGKWVVLEFASATCTQYTKNIQGMHELQKEFPDVEFLLVYVREAHPGERRRQHRSLSDKLKAASLLPKKYREKRRILIDSVNGDMHQAYGSMPNSVYVIRPDGTVQYRCNWATINGVRNALTDRDNYHTHENANMKELIEGTLFSWNRVKTMWTGGFIAFWDFVFALPLLIKRHKDVDRYYDAHGEFKK